MADGTDSDWLRQCVGAFTQSMMNAEVLGHISAQPRRMDPGDDVRDNGSPTAGEGHVLAQSRSNAEFVHRTVP
jgi:hypothetical protein